MPGHDLLLKWSWVLNIEVSEKWDEQILQIGRYRQVSWQRMHLTAMYCLGTICTPAGTLRWHRLRRTQRILRGSEWKKAMPVLQAKGEKKR